MRRPEHVTVVLPAYGPAGEIGEVLRDLAVAAYALSMRSMTLDLLVVVDETRAGHDVDALREVDDLDMRVLPGPTGDVGAAYLAGFRHVLAEGRADLVVTLDSNGRHDATEIPGLVDRLLERDLDVIIGSRWASGSGTPGLSVSRWVLGKLANAAFRTMTGTRGVSDATTSFRVARREVVERFRFQGVPLNSHSVQTAFVAGAVASGSRVGEGPIIYRPGFGVGGGLQLSDVAAFARHLLDLRRQVDRERQRRLSARGRVFSGDHFGAADDLERLGSAKHFFDWVLEEFHAHLKGRILEVGAGTGTITRKLLETYPDVEVVALEPAENMFRGLQPLAAMTARVEAHQRTLADHLADAAGSFDAVMYLNVLEHIEDDAAELDAARAALRPGGTLLVFGPALEWLYSDLDHKAGHYRRYTVDGLRGLAEHAGFEVVSVRYLDVLGVLPYLLVYRLLRQTEITGSTMWGYDRVVVPLTRYLQRLVPEPALGKNIALVARRP